MVVRTKKLLLLLIASVWTRPASGFFVRPTGSHRRGGPTPTDRRPLASSASTTTAKRTTTTPQGIGQALLNLALATPLWQYVLVPQARKKIVNTAEANGIPWNQSLEWIKAQNGPWNNVENLVDENSNTPAYYQSQYHSYEKGNLCWEAALEVELASCAVGARNFPAYGPKGEEAFRGAFAGAFQELGALVPKHGIIVDLGCGTGMSTRPLAKRYPQAKQIIGFDLSPYFIAVGSTLLELEPKSFLEGGKWVSHIEYDERIDYRVGDASHTGLSDESVDVVNLQFIVHELPIEVSKQIMDEAYRILKPGGQLWVGEMDFESPGYAAQRSNALLFSLIRATEPFLDVYADGQGELREYIAAKFSLTRVAAATGRHFALCATKHQRGEDTSQPGQLFDDRFDENNVYRQDDTHLKVWENKV